jgi:hypothetical protein
MLTHLGEQAERVATGLIGATMGVIFAFSLLDFITALLFTLSFIVLFWLQSVPVFLLKKSPGKEGLAFLFYIVFVVVWVITLVLFGRLNFWSDGWSSALIDKKLVFVLIVLFTASVASVVPQLVGPMLHKSLVARGQE